jgi:hypothetical protein
MARVSLMRTLGRRSRICALVWDRQVEIDWLPDRLARYEKLLQGEPDRRSTDPALNA